MAKPPTFDNGATSSAFNTAGLEMTLFPDGTKMWHRDGQSHRDDGPAIERADGSKSWWRNGQLHRDGGPAFEYANGDKAWYRNGKRHREDGPAVESADGTKQWWLYDHPLTEWGFSSFQATKLRELQRTVQGVTSEIKKGLLQPISAPPTAHFKKPGRTT